VAVYTIGQGQRTSQVERKTAGDIAVL